MTILVGFVFVAVSISIPILIGVLDLLPGFVGFVLLKRGIGEIRHTNENLQMAYRISNMMVPVAIVQYALFALLLFVFPLIWLTGGLLFALIAFAVKAAGLLVMFYLLKGFQDIEADTGWQLQTQMLWQVFLALCVCNVVAFVLGFIPVLGTLADLVSVAALAYFLYLFYQMYTRYTEYCNQW